MFSFKFLHIYVFFTHLKLWEIFFHLLDVVTGTALCGTEEQHQVSEFFLYNFAFAGFKQA